MAAVSHEASAFLVFAYYAQRAFYGLKPYAKALSSHRHNFDALGIKRQYCYRQYICIAITAFKPDSIKAQQLTERVTHGY